MYFIYYKYRALYYIYYKHWASHVVLAVKNLPANEET